jgi:mono/diheme cytochrome c family protein
MIKLIQSVALTCVALAPGLQAHANPIQDGYRTQAKAENPAFKDFSVAAGQKLYSTKVDELSCASCHTDSPLAAGKHAKTSKDILPLSPSVNAKFVQEPTSLASWSRACCTAKTSPDP